MFSGRSITVISFFLFLLYFSYRVILIFYQHPDAGGVEGNIIYFIQRLLDGQPVYTDPERAPYAIAQYSPLYYYLVAGVSELIGLTSDDILGVYAVSRSVSLFLNLVFVFIIFLTTNRVFAVTKEKSITVAIAAFIFLEITSFSRPDSLNHVFFFLTLYVFMNGIKTGKPYKPTIILTAMLAAVSIYCKQTSFLLPVIIGAWLLYRKMIIEVLLFSVVYLVLAVVFILPVYMSGELGVFYSNVVQGINNGISFTWFRGVILSDYYFSFGLLFVPTGLIVLYQLKNETSELLRFSCYLMVVLFGLLNIVSLKNGSNPGYFTEWWSLLFVLLAYIGPQLTKAVSVIDKRILAAIILFVFIIKAIKIEMPVRKMLTSMNAQGKYYKEKEVADYILGKLSPGSSHTVFANFNTADSYLSNILIKQVVAPQMDIIGLSTYAYKKFDYSDLIKSFEDGRIKWMLMRTLGPQKQFFEIDLNKFELDTTLNGFNVYKYRP
jgi:hypothetical protein